MLYTNEHYLRGRLEELSGKLLADIKSGISKAVIDSADNAVTDSSFSHMLYKLKLYQLFDRMMLKILVRLEKHELTEHQLSALMAMENPTLVEALVEGGEEIEKAAFRIPTDKAVLDFLVDVAENG